MDRYAEPSATYCQWCHAYVDADHDRDDCQAEAADRDYQRDAEADAVAAPRLALRSAAEESGR